MTQFNQVLVHFTDSKEFGLLTSDNANLDNLPESRLTNDLGNDEVPDVFGRIWFAWYTFKSFEELKEFKIIS